MILKTCFCDILKCDYFVHFFLTIYSLIVFMHHSFVTMPPQARSNSEDYDFSSSKIPARSPLALFSPLSLALPYECRGSWLQMTGALHEFRGVWFTLNLFLFAAFDFAFCQWNVSSRRLIFVFLWQIPLAVIEVLNFRGSLSSQKYLPREHHKNKLLAKLNRFTLFNWVSYIIEQMSRDMTKPAKWLCAQWRLRSAWASAQSDQSLRCALNG